MTYKSNPVGNEITCIMYGIKDAVLNDAEKLEQLLIEAAAVENFNILDKKSHIFNPRGYSAILLIQESHIAIHTYPEYNSLVFNLYSCRGPEDGKKTLEYFKNALHPSKIESRQNKVVVKT
jgi:S-adenosylmethionine decarboxylase